MRVLLADDHPLFRAGVASLLRASGAEVVGEVGDGAAVVEAARRLEPDLVLMDIGMPGCNGLEATRQIKAERPETRIVIVTVSDDDDDLFEAVRCGADGYLLKDMSEEDLSRTLDAVAAGRPALSPALAARVIAEFARAGRAAETEQFVTLTPRESDVLRLVATGATNREIASALSLAENTVHFHVKNILAKLQLKNRAQAAVYAVRSGIAEQPGSEGAAAGR